MSDDYRSRRCEDRLAMFNKTSAEVSEVERRNLPTPSFRMEQVF